MATLIATTDYTYNGDVPPPPAGSPEDTKAVIGTQDTGSVRTFQTAIGGAPLRAEIKRSKKHAA